MRPSGPPPCPDVSRPAPFRPAPPRPALTGTVLLAALVLLPHAGARAQPSPAARLADAPPVTFRILDRRDPRELAETTSVFVNGHRVGAFHLDDATPEAALAVTVPWAPTYDYALCGSITLRTPAGTELHRVNSSGRLDAVDGRVFEALGAADFTLFYLVDRDGNGTPGEVHAGGPEECAPATS